MKNYFFFIISICFAVISFSQNKENKIPRKTRRSIPLLSDHLTKDLKSEYDKVDSVYTWITTNIDYNYNKLVSDKPFKVEKSDKTLKSKKAICFEYCRLMKSMLAQENIESEVVNGYVRGVLKDSMLVPKVDSHSWLAIKIDGDWFLADPTWDAGYVGNIKTNKEEKFGKKFEKLDLRYSRKSEKLDEKYSATTKSSKQKKIKNKQLVNEKNREKAETKLKQKKDKTPGFTGQIGFVSDPKKDWFLINPDSFLLSHLPLNPMWQLKNDTLPIKIFAQGKDSIRAYIQSKKSEVYPFKREIETYQDLDYLEKMLWEAENGFDYNHLNCQVKAINYFNYINTVTDKKIKKFLPRKHQNISYSKLLDYVDTASTYAKLAKKESKERFTFYIKSFSKLQKTDLKSHKAYLKYGNKALTNHEKSIERIEKRTEKIEIEIDIINKKVGKLATNAKKQSFKEDEEKVQYLVDSLQSLLVVFDSHQKDWEFALDSTYLQGIIDTLLYNEFLFKLRNKYLEYQDFDVNRYINEVDTILWQNNIALNVLYDEKLEIEMLTDQLLKTAKTIGSFISYAKSELDIMSKNGEVNYKSNILTSFNYELLTRYKKLIKMNKEAIPHNEWMISTLYSFDKYWDKIIIEISKQEHLIEVRYEYNLERATFDYDREQNIYKKIEKSCSKWKKAFKELENN